MPKRISPQLRGKIERRIKKGWANRMIAEALHVHHATVARVEEQMLNPRFENVTAYRCPSCRGRVTTRPCVVCSLRKS